MQENKNLENLNNLDVISNLKQKRRGRPKKNQENNNDKKKKSKDQDNLLEELEEKEEEDIILHLPINLSDINNHKNADNQINKKENSIFTINDIDSLNSSNSDLSENSNISSLNENPYKIIKDQQKTIDKLNLQINEYEKKNVQDQDQTFDGTYNKHIKKMKTDFVFIDIKTNKQIILENTNISCWWCTYNFQWIPCLMPEKCMDGKYFVFGCFCTFNCMVSYNLFSLNDHNVWNRYSLIKKIHNNIFETQDDIPLAPQKETFEKFGGNLTHEQYIKNCKKCTKEYRFIMPPMTTILPLIEESCSGKDPGKVLHGNQELVLKRSKPLPNSKSSLIDSIKISNTKLKKK
jgi:hypothetical protein